MPHVVDPWTGCHLHTGAPNNHGYVMTWRDRQRVPAHIAAWEEVNGPVPEGKVLDHLCRRRNCRQPAHLEPVSKAENDRRRSPGYRSRITKCQKGHDLFEHGRRTPEGGNVCRICSGVWKPKENTDGRQSRS